ncbi:MAG: hypothetical protein PHR75_07270 [Sulfurovum sp.]|nr:hypothetical protein [Sulfurovum sp.]MDD3603323.1 hypothetical protein [Sulfurovum sp.]
MLKKLTPIIILILFAIGTYFMIQGMKNAVKMTEPKKVEEKK